MDGRAGVTAGPDGAAERVELRDGTMITIRAVQPGDAVLIKRGFARLGDESRRRRFLTPIGELDDAQLAYLTRIDHRDHEALGALGRNGEPVGVARYVRRIDDPEMADVAVAVVDEVPRRQFAVAWSSGSISPIWSRCTAVHARYCDTPRCACSRWLTQAA